MKSKLDQILRDLLNDRKLTDGQAVAIFGCLTLMAESTQDTVYAEFAKDYGQFACRGLSELLEESE